MRARMSVLGLTLSAGVILALTAPALAGGQDSANGTPINLTVTQAATPGEYTFTVSKFNGQAVFVRFWLVTNDSIDVDQGGGTVIGTCAPGDGNSTVVQNDTLTCTFTPSTSLSNGTFEIQAAEYDSPNTGDGNYIENNEVKEESNTVAVTNGVPENNLPEAPYAALLPVAAIGALLAARRLRARHQ